MEKDLLKLDDEKSVMEFLREPTVKIAEAITGILASDQQVLKLSAGKLVQAALKGKLLTQLGKELEQYREAGKIKEDYFATHKSQASLYELLKFLDEEVPDDELFAAIKSIFFAGISTDASGRDEILAYEFLQSAKRLSGTEILILKANFAIAQNKTSPQVSGTYVVNQGEQSRNTWAAIIADQMGYKGLGAMVSKYEENLISLGLISPVSNNANLKDMFVQTMKFRLTDMGLQFCEFMTKYK